MRGEQDDFNDEHLTLCEWFITLNLSYYITQHLLNTRYKGFFIAVSGTDPFLYHCGQSYLRV
jgi:hypothetical protein